jgi:arginase
MSNDTHIIAPRKRPIAIVGAVSNIGIRPYDNGSARSVDLAPRVLRELGLVERLAAHDHGDVEPPPYQDFVRPAGRPRNEEGVALYSRALAERIAEASANGAFVLVLGGECSIVLGCLLGLRLSGRAPVGLAYVDAHADFGTTEESRSGSASSMCLALAVGRGNTPLAHLGGDEPLAHTADVVLIGRRDQAEPWYGHEALRASAILDLPHTAVRERGIVGTSHAALDRVTQSGLAGFWIHFDADVLDPEAMPAVDSPVPGGLGLEEIAELLTPLVRHPRALGLELTIYDPSLDSDRTCAARLVTLLERVLIGGDD